MKPFLQEIAELLYAQNKRGLDRLTVVFPNRRAALYFRKHLTDLLDKPSFAPALITIEEFIQSFSTLKIPEKLQLIFRLQGIHNQVMAESGLPVTESFDQFYFWGEMLLRDFEETDKYMVKADHLFKDLSHQKEMDSGFDFLTEEQREFLRSFWINFEQTDSVNKKKFLEVWRRLPQVYEAFRSDLKKNGLAYEGMMHREVAENIAALNIKGATSFGESGQLNFVGFNALTKAEETIISYFVDQQHAGVFWDVDSYYINNERQEAARFFREYKEHRVLGKTFPPDVPSNLKKLKHIDLYAAAQPVGQAKLMAQVLQEKMMAGYRAEDTIIVLPDEKLLAPVLHGISADIPKLNVTMGFPLGSTPLFNLVELLIELQLNYKQEHFNHRPVVALLGHPYVVAADAPAAHVKRKEILRENWVSIPEQFLATTVELHRLIFTQPPNGQGTDLSQGLIGYLAKIIHEIGALKTITAFDKEYCFHFLRLLHQMEEVFMSGEETAKTESDSRGDGAANKQGIKSFLRIFRQIMRAEKIPFRGEPLKGLQIMGVLETRNLDFKNVFILSLNEGAFPSFSSKGSYIPYNIRKAYGMPTVEQQDAMYAYLFYRILQRAENVSIFYNSETDELGQGEMSRYLQQLLYESGIPANRHVLHNDLQPMQVSPVVVAKDAKVFQELSNYLAGAAMNKSLSPSALNDYLECRLKFYFKYVARIREADEVEEELDARVLGNFLHKVMEMFYLHLIEKKGSPTVEQADFENYDAIVSSLIDKAFIENYHLNPERKVVYEGQRLVVKEIVKRFVDRIMKIDKAYAPFTLEALERRDLKYSIQLDHMGSPVVVLGGSIDRADKKENTVRVIDYKTGKDALSFNDVPSLFSREGKRNKAAFQTLLYTLLYKKNLSVSEHLKFIPGLMNRINLFNEDFNFGLVHGKEYLQDASPLLDDFEIRVKELLEEIYNADIPFDQTSNTEACQFCPYHEVCYR